MAISSALRLQCGTKYNIGLYDEPDGPFASNWDFQFFNSKHTFVWLLNSSSFSTNSLDFWTNSSYSDFKVEYSIKADLFNSSPSRAFERRSTSSTCRTKVCLELKNWKSQLEEEMNSLVISISIKKTSFSVRGWTYVGYFSPIFYIRYPLRWDFLLRKRRNFLNEGGN